MGKFGERIRASKTSIESYKKLQKSGKDIKEKKRVLLLMFEGKSLTSRGISNLLNIERTNITRTLSDLQKDGLVEVAYEDKCSITNRKVKYYRLSEELKEGISF